MNKKIMRVSLSFLAPFAAAAADQQRLTILDAILVIHMRL
jgi:hypothetical protein